MHSSFFCRLFDLPNLHVNRKFVKFLDSTDRTRSFSIHNQNTEAVRWLKKALDDGYKDANGKPFSTIIYVQEIR